ncbi:MAG: hypothetical protein JST26_18205 [Bacteroidetes bacterium]|nr:hypothetical protein [Bacteroidota bacterium]
MLRRCLPIVSILLIVIFYSCHPDKTEVDTSKVTIPPVQFMRLDKDVFSLTPANIDARTKEYQKKYKQFYNRYVSNILNNGGVVDSSYSESLLRFVNDKDMSEAYREIEKKYSDNDVALIGEALEEPVKRFKALFPARRIPARYVTFMSGFNYNVVYVDSTIGIGLDKYLGADNRFYSMLQWPRFQVRLMDKPYIVPDVVRGWMITEFDNSDPVNNLLNHMVFYGKIYYLCDVLLPDTDDSLKIGYTTAQMKYCHEYEKNLWGYFVKDNQLYENDLKLIAQYTTDGPFTGAISKECPPRIAMWVGWQIVRAYMANNPEVTPEQLMKEKDVQKILSKSKYKP